MPPEFQDPHLNCDLSGKFSAYIDQEKTYPDGKPGEWQGFKCTRE